MLLASVDEFKSRRMLSTRCFFDLAFRLKDRMWAQRPARDSRFAGLFHLGDYGDHLVTRAAIAVRVDRRSRFPETGVVLLQLNRQGIVFLTRMEQPCPSCAPGTPQATSVHSQ